MATISHLTRAGMRLTAILPACAALGALGTAVTATSSSAQSPARQSIAVLAVNLNLERANAVIPGDTQMGMLATTRLREAIAANGAYCARMNSSSRACCRT